MTERRTGRRDATLHVSFVFASGGIGGAERSMLRLMRAAHPHTLDCSVLIARHNGNAALTEAIQALDVPCFRLGAADVAGMSAVLRDIKPDVVYLFGQVRTLLWAASARRAGGCALVGAERGSGTRLINRIGRRLDKHVLNAYITNSKHTAQVLKEKAGIPSHRLFVVYNGIEQMDEPAPPLPAGIVTGDPTVACVATIRPLKGHIVLLEALARLRTRYPAIRALLLGRDTTGGEFFAEAEARGLGDFYTWAGFVPDVRPYLAAADLFVLPSLYREGMPTSILEAMLAGLPVIASQVGGVDELIDDGRTGLLVAPGDAALLADKIDEVMNSDALKQALGQQGRAHVVANHTIQSMVAGHVRAFESVVNRRGR